MNSRQDMQIAYFFHSLAEFQNEVDHLRVNISLVESYDPFVIFNYLKDQEKNGITIDSIAKILKKQKLQFNSCALKLCINLFDTRFSEALDFEDFLKMFITKNDIKKFFDISKSTPLIDLFKSERIQPQLEYAINRFLIIIIRKLSEIISNKETKSAIEDIHLFRKIDIDRKGKLSFSKLSDYCKKSRAPLADNDILGVLRILDINDDGIVNQNDFNFFLDLFSQKGPQKELFDAMKETSNIFNSKNQRNVNDEPHKTDKFARTMLKTTQNKDQYGLKDKNKINEQRTSSTNRENITPKRYQINDKRISVERENSQINQNKNLLSRDRSSLQNRTANFKQTSIMRPSLDKRKSPINIDHKKKQEFSYRRYSNKNVIDISNIQILTDKNQSKSIKREIKASDSSSSNRDRSYCKINSKKNLTRIVSNKNLNTDIQDKENKNENFQSRATQAHKKDTSSQPMECKDNRYDSKNIKELIEKAERRKTRNIESIRRRKLY